MVGEMLTGKELTSATKFADFIMSDSVEDFVMNGDVVVI